MEVKKRGSDHYKTNGTEPIDLINSGGMLRDFVLSNIIKYAFRNRKKYRRVVKVSDLEKIKHYCDILIEYEVKRRKDAKKVHKIKSITDIHSFLANEDSSVIVEESSD